jgi:hypothetical protein
LIILDVADRGRALTAGRSLVNPRRECGGFRVTIGKQA